MNINVDNLNNGFTKEINFEEVLTLPKSPSFKEEAFIKCKANITNSSGKYTFKGEVLAEMVFICNSCLDEFKQVLQFDILEVFSKTDIDDEFWTFSSKDNIMYLGDAISSNVILNLPMKVLCSQNCEGLCIKCGHNLNNGDCGCDRGFIDPRFEKILHLFENKEV